MKFKAVLLAAAGFAFFTQGAVAAEKVNPGQGLVIKVSGPGQNKRPEKPRRVRGQSASDLYAKCRLSGKTRAQCKNAQRGFDRRDIRKRPEPRIQRR